MMLRMMGEDKVLEDNDEEATEMLGDGFAPYNLGGLCSIESPCLMQEKYGTISSVTHASKHFES